MQHDNVGGFMTKTPMGDVHCMKTGSDPGSCTDSRLFFNLFECVRCYLYVSLS